MTYSRANVVLACLLGGMVLVGAVRTVTVRGLEHTIDLTEAGGDTATTVESIRKEANANSNKLDDEVDKKAAVKNEVPKDDLKSSQPDVKTHVVDTPKSATPEERDKAVEAAVPTFIHVEGTDTLHYKFQGQFITTNTQQGKDKSTRDGESEYAIVGKLVMNCIGHYEDAQRGHVFHVGVSEFHVEEEKVTANGNTRPSSPDVHPDVTAARLAVDQARAKYDEAMTKLNDAQGPDGDAEEFEKLNLEASACSTELKGAELKLRVARQSVAARQDASEDVKENVDDPSKPPPTLAEAESSLEAARAEVAAAKSDAEKEEAMEKVVEIERVVNEMKKTESIMSEMKSPFYFVQLADGKVEGVWFDNTASPISINIRKAIVSHLNIDGAAVAASPKEMVLTEDHSGRSHVKYTMVQLDEDTTVVHKVKHNIDPMPVAFTEATVTQDIKPPTTSSSATGKAVLKKTEDGKSVVNHAEGHDTFTMKGEAKTEAHDSSERAVSTNPNDVSGKKINAGGNSHLYVELIKVEAGAGGAAAMAFLDIGHVHDHIMNKHLGQAMVRQTNLLPTIRRDGTVWAMRKTGEHAVDAMLAALHKHGVSADSQNFYAGLRDAIERDVTNGQVAEHVWKRLPHLSREAQVMALSCLGEANTEAGQRMLVRALHPSHWSHNNRKHAIFLTHFIPRIIPELQAALEDVAFKTHEDGNTYHPDQQQMLEHMSLLSLGTHTGNLNIHEPESGRSAHLMGRIHEWVNHHHENNNIEGVRQGIRALANSGHPDAMPHLHKYMEHAEPTIRGAAVRAMTHQKESPDVDNAIVNFIEKESDEDARTDAIRTLADRVDRTMRAFEGAMSILSQHYHTAGHETAGGPFTASHMNALHDVLKKSSPSTALAHKGPSVSLTEDGGDGDSTDVDGHLSTKHEWKKSSGNDDCGSELYATVGAGIGLNNCLPEAYAGGEAGAKAHLFDITLQFFDIQLKAGMRNGIMYARALFQIVHINIIDKEFAATLFRIGTDDDKPCGPAPYCPWGENSSYCPLTAFCDATKDEKDNPVFCKEFWEIKKQKFVELRFSYPVGGVITFDAFVKFEGSIGVNMDTEGCAQAGEVLQISGGPIPYIGAGVTAGVGVSLVVIRGSLNVEVTVVSFSLPVMASMNLLDSKKCLNLMMMVEAFAGVIFALVEYPWVEAGWWYIRAYWSSCCGTPYEIFRWSGITEYISLYELCMLGSGDSQGGFNFESKTMIPIENTATNPLVNIYQEDLDSKNAAKKKRQQLTENNYLMAGVRDQWNSDEVTECKKLPVLTKDKGFITDDDEIDEELAKKKLFNPFCVEVPFKMEDIAEDQRVDSPKAGTTLHGCPKGLAMAGIIPNGKKEKHANVYSDIKGFYCCNTRASLNAGAEESCFDYDVFGKFLGGGKVSCPGKSHISALRLKAAGDSSQTFGDSADATGIQAIQYFRCCGAAAGEQDAIMQKNDFDEKMMAGKRGQCDNGFTLYGFLLNSGQQESLEDLDALYCARH